MRTPWRKFLSWIEPEGIPRPGVKIYNALSRSGVFQRHYELVAEDIAARCAAGRILDVGAGPGWLLLKLRKRLPQAQLFGADISPAMVDKATENCRAAGCSDIAVQTAGAEHLPYPDGFFDVVVSTGSLHHWKNPAAGINEAHRVLKDGGVALLYDLVRDVPKPVALQVRRQFGRFRWVMLWLHSFEEPFYSDKEMENLARGTAFAEGQTSFVGALCRLTLEKKRPVE
jgi:ubiquinone/menaquinone biosynthesis C-methylase UbiE